MAATLTQRPTLATGFAQTRKPDMNTSPSLLSTAPGQAQALGHTLSAYRDMVSQSWRRCLDEYHLNPAQADEPPWVGHQELRTRMERQADIIDCARHEMEALHQQLADEHCAVVLTDAEGVIVHMVASPEFAAQGQSLGLRAGGAWGERVAGTNGMGTCLASHSPILIHKEEHFFRRLSQFTCSAVPLLDPQGNMAAVLDVTSRSALVQPSLLTLLDSTVRQIEGRLIDRRFANAYPVRFHSRTEGVFGPAEGRLAVSGDGHILAANRSALLHLGYRSVQALCQLRLEDLFELSLDELLQSSMAASYHPVATCGQGDARFYAVAQRPATAVASRRLTTTAVVQPQAGSGTKQPPGRAQPAALPEPAGDALSFKDLRLAAHLKTACRVIAHRTPILLCAETGAGKEVFAKAVHQASPHAMGPFVAINCASLPATLIEAELFGYRAGAFTGAKRGGREGKILQAHKGTLFLDEIADMPLELQARLLRVLDERQVSPLGTDECFKVDFQLISASHQHLPDLVRQHKFREDLYFRLLGIELRLPPLRERQDKRELMWGILQAEAGPAAHLSEDAEEVLMRYPWPGNVRQLRHVLRTAAALADGTCITPAHLVSLPEQLKLDASGQAAQSCPEQEAQAMKVEADPSEPDVVHPDHTAVPHGQAGLGTLTLLQRHERQALIQLIEDQHWTMSRVAHRLGVSRNTLYRKLHKLQIPLNAQRSC
jgi:transcriptional regulator of acetoin/glycerol metabolism